MSEVLVRHPAALLGCPLGITAYEVKLMGHEVFDAPDSARLRQREDGTLYWQEAPPCVTFDDTDRKRIRERLGRR